MCFTHQQFIHAGLAFFKVDPLYGHALLSGGAEGCLHHSCGSAAWNHSHSRAVSQEGLTSHSWKIMFVSAPLPRLSCLSLCFCCCLCSSWNLRHVLEYITDLFFFFISAWQLWGYLLTAAALFPISSDSLTHMKWILTKYIIRFYFSNKNCTLELCIHVCFSTYSKKPDERKAFHWSGRLFAIVCKSVEVNATRKNSLSPLCEWTFMIICSQICACSSVIIRNKDVSVAIME